MLQGKTNTIEKMIMDVIISSSGGKKEVIPLLMLPSLLNGTMHAWGIISYFFHLSEDASSCKSVLPLPSLMQAHCLGYAHGTL